MTKAKIGDIHFFRMDRDDDLLETVKRKAEENGVKAGAFIMIGALENVVMGCYRNGDYVYTRLDGPLEIASCIGDIAVDEKGETVVHAHLVVSNEKGEAFGGHLMKGSRVGPTAELVMIEAVGLSLQRALDAKTGLKLLKLG